MKSQFEAVSMFSAMLLHMVLILCYLRFCPVFGFTPWVHHLFIFIYQFGDFSILIIDYQLWLLLVVVSLYVIVVLSASLLVLISVTFSFFLFHIVFWFMFVSIYMVLLVQNTFSCVSIHSCFFLRHKLSPALKYFKGEIILIRNHVNDWSFFSPFKWHSGNTVCVG